MSGVDAVPADVVQTNGKIVTMDAGGKMVEAAAVTGDRIVATGSGADMDPLIGNGTRVIDLGGRVVLPGFIDSHVHFDCTAAHTKLAGSCHIPPVEYVRAAGSTESREAILNWVRAETEKAPKGRWIVGQGRFTLETDGNSPTKLELDRIAPDHAVMIRYNAHSQLLNRRALEIAGITRDAPTQTALDAVAPGGRIVRDSTSGEPTGVILEAIDWVFRDNPWPYDDLKGAILETCREAASFGVTGINEFMSWSDSARIYQELYQAGDLPLRVQLCPCVWGIHSTATMDGLARLGLKTGFGDDWVKFGSAKVFIGGGGRDADCIYQQWMRLTQGKLNDLVAGAHKAGIRMMMHAISRESQGMAIGAVEAPCRSPRATTTVTASNISAATIGPRDSLNSRNSASPRYQRPTAHWVGMAMPGSTTQRRATRR